VVGDDADRSGHLSSSRESQSLVREGMRHDTDQPLLASRVGIQLPLRVE
jgi:hypothetical protein